LAAIAECDERIRVGDDKYHERKAGEPLHAEREPLSVLHQIRQEMGPDAWAAQYQQNPVPPGGIIIKREWIRFHNIKSFQPSYRHRVSRAGTLLEKPGRETPIRLAQRRCLKMVTTTCSILSEDDLISQRCKTRHQFC
jgi:hypothetical protein